MPDQSQVDAGLFMLAFFVALALAGVMYIEHLFARMARRQRERIDSLN